MGHWKGRIRVRGAAMDAEVWWETPEESRQGFRWHGILSGVPLRGAAARRLAADLSSPEAPHTLETDIGLLQVETASEAGIGFRGRGAPRGPLAAAAGGTPA